MALQGKTLEERFWLSVDKSGECWLWTAGGSPQGYGTTSSKNDRLLAHRVSYELAKGPIGPGLFVCHTCDIRRCVNPAHLFLGTNTDNMRDMIAKGRGWQQLKTHCKHGHEFTPENLRPSKHGHRLCLACHTHYKEGRRIMGPHKKHNSYAHITHCTHGHEFTPENTYTPPGTSHRQCRACKIIFSSNRKR